MVAPRERPAFRGPIHAWRRQAQGARRRRRPAGQRGATAPLVPRAPATTAALRLKPPGPSTSSVTWTTATISIDQMVRRAGGGGGPSLCDRPSPAVGPIGAPGPPPPPTKSIDTLNMTLL